MKRRWKSLLLVLVLAAGGGVLFAFLYLRPLPVAVVEPEHDLPIQVFGLGTVEARIRSQVGFEVGGALIELHADHGDHIKRGAVLARCTAPNRKLAWPRPGQV